MRLTTMAHIALIRLFAALCLSGSVSTAQAGYLTSGVSFFDGMTVHSADLNNAINNAIIGSGFVSGQQLNPSPQNSDQVLLYSPTLNGLFKEPVSTIFGNSQNYTLLSPGIPNINTNDLFVFFSQGSGTLLNITYTQLVLSVSSNIQPQYFSFAPTNNNNGATNLFVLSNAGSAWQPTSTNQQPFALMWTNNGVPYQIPYSTMVDNASSLIGTNLYGWDFNHMFRPWLIYGTNSISPFTNMLGFTTNVMITNLTMASSFGSNIVSLSDTDTVPINSYSMGANGTTTSTNTVVTLNALFQYFTNKNGLPPYTFGREQFNGTAVSLVVCNTPSAGYIGPSGNFNIIAVTTNSITFNPLVTNNIFAFTLITNGNTMFQGSGGVDTTNQVYWGVPFLTSSYLLPTNVMFVNVFTNYVSAVANGISQSGSQTYSANFGTGNSILIVTNLTSFNGDVAPATTPGSPPTVRTGVYLFGFRTNSANANYYITGSTVGTGGGGRLGGVLTMPTSTFIGTSFFQFGTFDPANAAFENFPVTQVLAQPQ